MNPVNLTIDGRPIAVAPGTTILAAARKLDLSIPTLCHVEGFEPSASCFLCAVKIEGRPNLWPSCATPAAEGMAVITNSEEVRSARRTSLELLLYGASAMSPWTCRMRVRVLSSLPIGSCTPVMPRPPHAMPQRPIAVSNIAKEWPVMAGSKSDRPMVRTRCLFGI